MHLEAATSAFCTSILAWDSMLSYSFKLCNDGIFLNIGATARSNVYSQGVGPIYGFRCQGNERSLSSCTVLSLQTIVACSHSRDVGVDCEGEISLIDTLILLIVIPSELILCNLYTAVVFVNFCLAHSGVC